VNTVEPVLFPMEWEEKVGWSTNVVKIEEDKYLVGWHAVLKEDLSYKNGFAFLDRYGRIISITDYLLSPEGLIESYGDRALVIFGDGLLKYKEYIIWIGGISDYAIGIFITTLKDVLNSFF
ncbi:MAG TPA: glycosidase, partial [Candidatus Atribacteria bacterium]|nr:glycosidase [Candidatus Atribacteria bacterium]